MTLSELALTVAVLVALGLAARRLGLSAIPAYLFACLLLGPNEPEQLAIISTSEVTDFVAELGIVFLLFFLGLEFSLSRLTRTGRHIGLGGTVDLVANLGLCLLVCVAAFGVSYAALILAAAFYVSSSAVAEESNLRPQIRSRSLDQVYRYQSNPSSHRRANLTAEVSARMGGSCCPAVAPRGSALVRTAEALPLVRKRLRVICA
ncbi:hypothetical protein BH09ACT13_BH09ACT13_14840 [soil metagenome]